MVAPPKPQRILAGQARDEFLAACGRRVKRNALAAATFANYRDDITDFVRLIGEGVVVDDITGEDVEDALLAFADIPDRRFGAERAARDVGKSWPTQERFRRSVTQFFSHAETHRWVQMSPMVFVKARERRDDSGVRSERRSLYPPQAEALMRYGAGDPAGQARLRPHERNYERDAYLITLMLVLGPRVSEVTGTNRSDMSDTGSGLVWRILGKGKKGRTLPLSEQLVELRQAYQKVRPAPSAELSGWEREDALRAEFVTGRGRRMNARDIQRMMHRAYKRVQEADPAQAREVTPHALRHTAATLLLANGWDVKVVRDLLGHSSIATTSLYLDEINDELVAAIRSHPLFQSVPNPAVGQDVG